MTDTSVELPTGHAYHVDRRLDVYLGNMIANRRCEIDMTSYDEVVILICGCPKQHLCTVRRAPVLADDYADRKISEIENAFTCC